MNLLPRGRGLNGDIGKGMRGSRDSIWSGLRGRKGIVGKITGVMESLGGGNRHQIRRFVMRDGSRNTLSPGTREDATELPDELPDGVPAG